MFFKRSAGWRQFNIGAGGYVTRINFTDDGTQAIRVDTYGAYIKTPSETSWRQVLTVDAMPEDRWDEGVGFSDANGVYEIVAAPTLTSRFYMWYNGKIYRSDDSGYTFYELTGFAEVDSFPLGGVERTFGPYMAVDPANADVVIAGTFHDGVWRTDDGGSTWTEITGIATPSAIDDSFGGYLVVFDPTSAVSGGKTQGIFISSYGTGVYQSTTGASGTFNLTSSTPTTHRQMQITADGILFLTDGSGTSSNLWIWDGSWTESTLTVGGGASTWFSIAPDPSDVDRIVVAADNGSIAVSLDAGSNWTAMFSFTDKVAADIPWLAETYEPYMSCGSIAFDPTETNKLMFAQGLGVWYTNPPDTASDYTWTSESLGIEQLIGNCVIANPNGSVVLSSWDRATFYSTDPEVFPSLHGPSMDVQIRHGWSMDRATSDPTFIAAIFNLPDKSGYSTDSGQTWTEFAAKPAVATYGGCIACSSPTSIVWIGSNNGALSTTQDGGVSWTTPSISGIATSGEIGWGFFFASHRQIVAADRVDAGVYYAYNYGSASTAGLYRSDNNGVAWSRVFTGNITGGDAWGSTLKAVPGNAGHLFFTGGGVIQSGNSHPVAVSIFKRSEDYGETWDTVADMLEVHAFGFGPIASGQTYPSICVAGYLDGIWGIYVSYDNCSTWTMIGDYPVGKFAPLKSIDGDKNVLNKWYASTQDGFVYYRP